MRFKNFIVVLILGVTCLGRAQTGDLQLWLNAGTRKLINNKTNVTINLGTRIAENISWRNYQFVQVGLQRKVLPSLAFGLACRLFQAEEFAYSRYKLRLMADLMVKKKWEEITFSFRSRFQLDKSLINNYESALLPIYKWRNRIELTFRKGKRFQPDFSSEIWYDFRPRLNSFNNLRLRTGITYQQDKHHAYSAGFIYDHPMNRIDTYTTAYIINCSYLVTF